MDKKLVWWPLIAHITAYLQKAESEIDKKPPADEAEKAEAGKDPQKAKADTNQSLLIYAGTKGPARTYPCIEITWDHESLSMGSAGFASIWIDICLKTDSKDPSEAYQKQYDYQTKIIDMLNSWPRQLIADTGIAVKMVIEDIVSDGDIQRPVSMSRIILSIDWRVQNGY